MREIKFRAWLKKQKLMRYNVSIHAGQIFTGYCWIPFDNNVELMQYAGVEDKNGEKIFEGDIVKHIKGNTYIVEFYNGGFKLLRFSIYKGKPVAYHDFEVRILTEIEVIGNIYENKDLLGWFE